MMVHTLSLTQTSPYPGGHFKCNLCWEKGSGPVYHCAHCEFDLHVACAAIAKQQTHFTHYKHPLHLCHCSTGHSCDGCGEDIHTWAFRCDVCDFDMHSLCVRAPRFIFHPSHPHALTLIKSSEMVGSCQCDGCGRRAMDGVYRCRSCNYDLHQSCATLPLKINHHEHPEHTLSLLFEPPNEVTFTCAECGEQGKGWLFHCASCRFNLHPVCANISHELPHASLETTAHERSNATVPSAPSVLLNASPAPTLCTGDLEAVERVLCFAREMLKGSSPHATQDPVDDEQDICPTCLEGYGPGNPKKEHKLWTSFPPILHP